MFKNVLKNQNSHDFMAELMIVAMRAEMTMMVSNLQTENKRQKTQIFKLNLKAESKTSISRVEAFSPCLCSNDVSLTSQHVEQQKHTNTVLLRCSPAGGAQL